MEKILMHWVRDNAPNEAMFYERNFWEQIIFIRNTITPLFYDKYKDIELNPIKVINTHISKSIKLPVYYIPLNKYKVKLILRNNFHDWKVSISSYYKITSNFNNIFNENKKINSIYCEGFKDNQVFDNYKSNQCNFTVEIDNNYKLYTFMWILKECLKNRKY